MKAVRCLAHPNIAFIKYWGKRDERERLPLNPSISMNLDRFYVIASIVSSGRDEVQVPRGRLSPRERDRLLQYLRRAKKDFDILVPLKVSLESHVPKAVGLASSAAVFASLAGALGAYAGKSSVRELSIVARRGSGSACRSVPDGFVRWKVGTAKTSFAYSVAPPHHLPVVDCILVGRKPKTVSSTVGQVAVHTSSILDDRLREVRRRDRICLQAIQKKDWRALFPCIVEETFSFLALLLTQREPLFYLSLPTLKIIASLMRWHLEGFPLAFTVDAGDTLHIFTKEKQLKELPSSILRRGVTARPAEGVRVLQ